MRRRHYQRLCGLLLLFVLVSTSAFAESRHVVIISIDGFRPEFYLPGPMSAVCETLKELCAKGSYAKGAQPPYPSMTYPGHTTIATGVLIARHGVIANNVFTPPVAEGRGFWYASDVQVPALWDVAHAAGLKVGAVSWPCTAGSKSIDWNLPEFWTTPAGKEIDIVRQNATTGLVEQIERSLGSITNAHSGSAGRWDAFLTGSAATILREDKPNLLFLHVLEADKVQHKGGRSAPELSEAMRRIDGDIYDLIEGAKKAGLYDRATFIVLGDHGFADVTQSIAPNVVLAGLGFLPVDKAQTNDWKAMVQNTGGSAGVYLKNPQDAVTAGQVRALLQKRSFGVDGKAIYRLIEKEQLTKLGGPRDAAFYLEAELGYMFSGAVTGEFLRKAPLKGNHGFLPDKREMHTGFIAAGRGVKKGIVLDIIRLADVAPTVAKLLGIELKNPDGRVLQEILE